MELPKDIAEKLASALPVETGYEKGYRDALESISLALAQTVSVPILNAAVETALDAYANNVDDESLDLVMLNLNIFDAEGNVVDGATATMSIEQISDTLDKTSQLILMRRDGEPIDAMLDDLDGLLSDADVIERASVASETPGPSK